MADEITLEEIYTHPFVEELMHENKTLKKQTRLSDKPDVEDLNNISLPYVIKNHLLIDEGVHNEIEYKAQILRMAIKQHEDLSIFLDHHDNNTGGTTQTWVGEIKNPHWSEKQQGVIGDVEIVDPKSAMAIAYGAKWGLSATVDVEQQANPAGGADLAADPVFKSYSLVLNPAVRGTMLNEEAKEDKITEEGGTIMEELKLKDDLKPAMDTLDKAIKQATAKRDEDILVSLRQTKAILAKLAGTTYPYPGKEEKMEKDELEVRLGAVEKVLLELKPREESEEEKRRAEELSDLKAKNKTMSEELASISREKLAVHSQGIIKKELEIGLISKEDVDARTKELEGKSAEVLSEIERNLDKTIQILKEGEEKLEEKKDTEPDKRKQETLGQKEKGKADSDASDRKLLQMMVDKGTTGKMAIGGY